MFCLFYVLCWCSIVIIKDSSLLRYGMFWLVSSYHSMFCRPWCWLGIEYGGAVVGNVGFCIAGGRVRNSAYWLSWFEGFWVCGCLQNSLSIVYREIWCSVIAFALNYLWINTMLHPIRLESLSPLLCGPQVLQSVTEIINEWQDIHTYGSY
jgi:hypothetical protein